MRILAIAALLLALVQTQPTSAQGVEHLDMESHIGNLTGHAKAGEAQYKRFCIGCHGPLGDGEGENSSWVDPKPRNFTLGIFKCRSTPSGTLPLDQCLTYATRSARS